jgi:hypothetical protein
MVYTTMGFKMPADVVLPRLIPPKMHLWRKNRATERPLSRTWFDRTRARPSAASYGSTTQNAPSQLRMVGRGSTPRDPEAIWTRQAVALKSSECQYVFLLVVCDLQTASLHNLKHPAYLPSTTPTCRPYVNLGLFPQHPWIQLGQPRFP